MRRFIHHFEYLPKSPDVRSMQSGSSRDNIIETQRTTHEVTLEGVVASTLRGIWPKVALIIFGTELVFLFVGSTIPISQSTVDMINSQNSALANTSESLGLLARAIFLFSHNFQLALLEFVPVLGWFTFAFSIYGTALAIEVIGIVSHLPGPLVALSLLLQPHTWIELPAYAFATTQSFFLVSTVARRSRFRFEVVRTALVFGFVAVELFVAGLFESLEISLSSSILLTFVVPWLLFVVVAGLFFGSRSWMLNRAELRAEQLQVPGITAPLFCQRCGARVPKQAVFCDQCGESLSP